MVSAVFSQLVQSDASEWESFRAPTTLESDEQKPPDAYIPRQKRWSEARHLPGGEWRLEDFDRDASQRRAETPVFARVTPTCAKVLDR